MKMPFKFMTVASLLLMPVAAHAGFQFTAPIQQPSNSQITPLPSIRGTAPQSMPAVPAIKVQSEPVHPVMAQPKPPMVQQQFRPVAPQQTMAVSNENSLAVGFGKDLPLVTALRQVVPEGYTYVMDDNIAVGKTVSWNGGQPWPVVLNKMAGDVGLQTQIDGKIVRITQQNQMPSVPQSQPVRVASAPQYTTPTITYDAPPVAPIYDSPQNIAPINRPYGAPVIPQAQTSRGPTNILAPQLQSSSIQLQTTETEDLQELQKSIIPEVTSGQWIAQSGRSLKTVLESWSNLEGVDLFWSADYDYILAGDANISGNFEEAVEELLKGFSDANPKPTGRLHPNLPHGPAVLVIETKELKE